MKDSLIIGLCVLVSAAWITRGTDASKDVAQPYGEFKPKPIIISAVPIPTIVDSTGPTLELDRDFVVLRVAALQPTPVGSTIIESIPFTNCMYPEELTSNDHWILRSSDEKWESVVEDLNGELTITSYPSGILGAGEQAGLLLEAGKTLELWIRYWLPTTHYEPIPAESGCFVRVYGYYADVGEVQIPQQ
jgi:hypothetical protein